MITYHSRLKEVVAHMVAGNHRASMKGAIEIFTSYLAKDAGARD